MTTKEQLQAALDLLKDGEGWCQNWFAYAQDGTKVMSRDPKATRFCMAGALLRVLGQNSEDPVLLGEMEPWMKLAEVQKGFVMWQDEAGRTFEEVEHLFQKAIALCD